jgi:hypothetical protein
MRISFRSYAPTGSVLLLLLVPACSEGRASADGERELPPVAPALAGAPVPIPSDRVVIEEVREHRPAAEDAYGAPIHEAEIRYPRISGTLEAETLEQIRKAAGIEAAFGMSLQELREYGWLMELGYTVNFNRAHILDLTWVMHGLGAYPSASVAQVTLDLRTGRRIAVRDLFAPESLAALAAEVDARMQAAIRAARDRLAADGSEDLESYFEAARFSVEDLQSFSIDEQGVTFFYDFGFPHVIRYYEPESGYLFTYEQLRPYVRADGPLGFAYRD